MKKQTLLILGLGAIGLYAFMRYRQGLPILPGFGSPLAGQGTAGSGTLNPSLGGSTSNPGGGGGTAVPRLPTIPTQPFSEAERIRLRNLATGPGSRGSCLIQNGCRWIDTQTGPLYGLGVSQAQFDRWMKHTYPGDSQPTLVYVKAVLGLA